MFFFLFFFWGGGLGEGEGEGGGSEWGGVREGVSSLSLGFYCSNFRISKSPYKPETR